MKRLLSLCLLLAVLLSMAMPVFAQDVYDSLAEEYEDETTGQYIQYRLIVPESYDPKYQFPLVVFFHGAGERGTDNESQLNNCVQMIADNMPKAIILVPQCDGLNQWVDTPWTEGCYSTDEVEESDEMKAVMALIGQIKQTYTVDETSVYAMGVSMGAFAVWDAMVRHNEVFAAGVACCGAGDPSKAEILKDTPMFVFHGTADDAVPFSGSADTVKAIQDAGGTKVQFTEYPGDGHGIWDRVYRQETLYQAVKKCHLSQEKLDKLHPKTEKKQDDGIAGFFQDDVVKYALIGAAGVIAVGGAVTAAIVVSKKKKKSNGA